MLRLQQICIDTGSADNFGRLVFDGNKLIAVLVRLDDAAHEDMRGRWHFEALFDRLPKTNETFPNETLALEWIERHHSR